jgi:hypothetical protein
MRTSQRRTLVVGLSLWVNALIAAPSGAIALKAWDRQIAKGNQRFAVLASFGGDAVLDKETQLVWAREPFGATIWFNARQLCAEATIGGRMGWRLPSLHELTSLLDPAESSPALSEGHPFTDVSSSIHWTSTVTTGSVAPVAAWGVDVTQGQIHFALDINTNRTTWCVRGPGPLSAY